MVHVKTIPAKATVGYGVTYTAQKEEYIATVPIGYADGWTRDLQGFSVLVNGEFCEIVGRVSMDQITIRLPENFQSERKLLDWSRERQGYFSDRFGSKTWHN